MRHWLSAGFIVCYLSALGWGVVSHALKFGNFSHPVMYFFVWDMFCGWQAYESRSHLIAQGESGTFYELSPAPWGTFAPFGDLPRTHYDTYGHTFRKVALTTLKHTEHEPIRRILVVEECWAKKYNLPDHLWAMKFDEPKDSFSYLWLRAAMTGDGALLESHPDFVSHCAGMTLLDNPRLVEDAKRGRPFFAVSPYHRTNGGNFDDPTAWAGGPNSFHASAH